VNATGPPGSPGAGQKAASIAWRLQRSAKVIVSKYCVTPIYRFTIALPCQLQALPPGTRNRHE
jgi:hypothetical protein